MRGREGHTEEGGEGGGRAHRGGRRRGWLGHTEEGGEG